MGDWSEAARAGEGRKGAAEGSGVGFEGVDIVRFCEGSA
jgi:hypothetical protein